MWNNFKLVFAFLFVTGFGLNHGVKAQDNSQEPIVKYKIITNVDGESQEISGEVPSLDSESLKAALEKLEKEIEMLNGDASSIDIDVSVFAEEMFEGSTNVFLKECKQTPVNKAFLGVHAKVFENGGANGLAITEIVEGSAAEEAGLQKGDMILKVADVDISNFEDLVSELGKFQPNDEVVIAYDRNGNEYSTTAKLQDRATNELASGMKVYHFGPECISKVKQYDGDGAFMGVVLSGDDLVIEEVVEDSPAEKFGLEVNDIITHVDENELKSYSTLLELLNGYKAGDEIIVGYQRDGEDHERSLVLAERIIRQAQFLSGDFDFDIDMDFDIDVEEVGGEKIIRIEGGNGSMEDVIVVKDEGDVVMIEKNGQTIIMDSDDQEVMEWTEENEDGSIRKTVIMKVVTEEIEEDDSKAMKRVYKSDGINSEVDVEFYPNPNNGRFTLNFSLPANQKTIVKVSQMDGKTVYREVIRDFDGSYNNEIDISKNSAGTYILEIEQKDNLIRKQIVVQ